MGETWEERMSARAREREGDPWAHPAVDQAQVSAAIEQWIAENPLTLEEARAEFDACVGIGCACVGSPYRFPGAPCFCELRRATWVRAGMAFGVPD